MALHAPECPVEPCAVCGERAWKCTPPDCCDPKHTGYASTDDRGVLVYLCSDECLYEWPHDSVDIES